MATGKVEKIYQLKTLGYDELMKELDAVTKRFEAIKKAKVAASQSQNVFSAADANDVKKYADELAKLAITEQELKIETERLNSEIKAAQLLRQQDINKKREEKGATDALAGSYNALYKEYRELYKLVKAAPEGTTVNFRDEILQYDQAILKLKELAAAEQTFRRQFSKDGTLVGEYTSGIIQAFKNMGLDDLIAGQVTKATQKLDLLNGEFNELQRELSETRVSGQGSLEMIEKQLIDNRKEALALTQQVEFLRTELRGTGDIGNQITNSISKGFKDVKTQIAQVAVGYIGVQAAIQGIISSVDNAGVLSDQTTDLEIQLNKAAGGADNLVESLSKLDTRTKLTALQEISDTALKAGTTADNILEVTEAIDKTKIAFGKDFGSVQEGTETFAKLIAIFYEDREITGERILKIGNSIRTLANETVASVPFINDFNGRMAGLRQLFNNFELSDSIGLGAGFEEFKQSAEVSSTVLVKVLPKIAAETEKFAKIAGMSKEAFADLLNSDPTEALIRVSEALVKTGNGVEEVSQQFADSELGSGRITTILATLGGNADVFRERIARAGVAIEDTGAITDAFAQKNDNLASQIDKVKKGFADAANSRAFQVSIGVISSIILFLISNFGIIISLLGGFTAVLALANAQLIIQRTQLMLVNAQLLAGRAALAVITIAQTAYNTALAIYAGITRTATGATILLSNAMRLLPIGLILTVLGVLVATFRAFGDTVRGATGDLKRLAIQKQLTADIAKRVADATTEEISKIQTLTKVAGDNTISLNTRKKALDDLIAINPEYLKGLTLENIATQEGTNIINQYIAALREKAALQAAQAIRDEKLKEDARLQLLQTKLETRIASGGSQDLGDLSDEEKELVGDARKNFAFIASVTDLVTGSSAAKEALEGLKLQRSNIAVELDETDNLIKEKYQKMGKTIAAGPNVNPNEVELSVFELFNRLVKTGGTEQQFQDLLKRVQDQMKNTSLLSKEYQRLRKLEEQIQQLIDPSKRGNRGSRLSGGQKDALKDIDAQRDTELADTRRLRTQNLISEEDYLQEVRDINVGAIKAKLELITGANAEERKLIADLKLDKVTQEQETNNKLFQLRSQALRNQLDQEIAAIRQRVAIETEDPTISETERAQKKLDADQQILNLQLQFAKDLDSLEQQLGQQSLKNAKESADAILKTQEDLRKDQIALMKASLTDVQNAGDKSIAEFRAIVARQRVSITSNKKLSPDKKSRALEVLDREETVGVVAREVASLQNQLPKYQQLLKEKQITDQQYSEFQEELANKQAELNLLLEQSTENALKKVKSLKEIIQEGIRDLFGFKSGSWEDQLLGQAINETYQIAEQAMNQYFDAKEARIQRDLELETQKLDIELEQQKRRAQSVEEQDSLEKQFALKKRAAEKEAFEKTKELKKKEAKIALATELGNLWASVWSLGWPPAAIAMGAVMSGLALARYAMRIADINSQTFAYGGQPGSGVKPTRYTRSRQRRIARGGDVPTRGGTFRGKPHSQGGTPFHYKGQSFEAEVGELAVIRTRDTPRDRVYQAVGTQAQIASAMNVAGGGVDFSPGANLQRFASGGSINAPLQAPQYIPSQLFQPMATGNTEILDELAETRRAMIQLAREQSARIDRLSVVQVTSTVTSAQKKEAQQSEIGRL